MTETNPLETRLAKVEGLAVERENEIRRLRRVNGQLGTTVTDLEAKLDRYSTIKAEDMKVPAWLKPKTKKSRNHVCTAMTIWSDFHLDEMVDLDEMDGINEYSREIAEKRFDNVVNDTVKLLKQYSTGAHIEGIVVNILGDMLTGEIHDELSRTNYAPPPASIVHWVPLLAAGLKHLADEFGQVFVPCVDGNHDRTYKRTPKKKRAESSYAWIIYNWLADTLRDDDRIKFGISTSNEQLISVYDTTFLLTHGDSFRSAGGVGGLYPSMLKWLLRRHQLYSATKKDFDYALMGHWHQDLWGQDFVVNASLKGYDEYAKDSGFTFGKAGVQLWTVTPEYGMDNRRFVFAD